MKIDKLKNPTINQNGYHKNIFTKERIGTLFIYPIDYTPDDCLPCNGFLLQISDYEDLYNIIGKKFNKADDAEGTFRIPDYNITGKFLQPGSNAGEQIAAGLPNITGTFNSRTDKNVTGCFTAEYFSSGQAFWSNVNNDPYYVKTLNASLSSSIYGNSSTVQPPAQLVHICIKYK